MKKRYVVIMAGGNGERFWPESRVANPKQFLPIVGDIPMLKQTINRLKDFIDVENIFVITNAKHRSIVLAICPELDTKKVIGEPIGRDTAPAVALATLLVQREDPDAIFAMLPADAVIQDKSAFYSVLESSFKLAETEPALVTIGIKPSHPATGYGYIQKSNQCGEFSGNVAYSVKKFVEKPNFDKAKAYLESGDFYWNAGMFIWSVSVIRSEFEKNCAELWRRIEAMTAQLDLGKELNVLLESIYPDLEKISVDYAIIEKASKVVMFESLFDWDDVGEWSAVARHDPIDSDGNCSRGLSLAVDSKNNIISNRDDKHVVTLLGVEDLIVVHTEDATLVCKKDQSQAVKNLVQRLSKKSETKKFI